MARTYMSAAESSLEFGHTALLCGSLERAVRYFHDAYDSGAEVEGAQMAGITCRLLGEYDKALDWFKKAITAADTLDKKRDLHLGAIYRDMAEVYHDQWLYDPHINKTVVLELADKTFGQSEDSLKSDSLKQMKDYPVEERHTTNGFYGLFLADTASSNIHRWETGVALLFASADALKQLGNRRYEFNNLIRLLRVSVTARIFRLPRAVWLVFNVDLDTEALRLEGIDKLQFDIARLFKRDPGVMADVKRLLAALLGNRFYHKQKQRHRS